MNGRLKERLQSMGVFSIEKETAITAGPVPAETTDAWSGAWPQNVQELGTLVEAYLGRLVIYASRRLANVHDAEDVVQDVFVQAFVSRAKLRRVSRVGAYLYRMTANACTDVLRGRRRRTACIPLMEIDGEGVPAAQGDPSEVMRTAEEASRVEQLLRRLPKAQAEAIRLRVFGELGLSEIAEVTGCSINTASSRLRYGFRKLRRIVAKEWKA
jgi:RNA polymerase sigma factor (sigma-70 family)